MAKCPRCGEELKESEVLSIVQAYRGSKTSAKKAGTSRANLQKALEKRKISSARNEGKEGE